MPHEASPLSYVALNGAVARPEVGTRTRLGTGGGGGGGGGCTVYVADASNSGLMHPSMHSSAETVCGPTVEVGALAKSMTALQSPWIGTGEPTAAPSQ